MLVVMLGCVNPGSVATDGDGGTSPDGGQRSWDGTAQFALGTSNAREGEATATVEVVLSSAASGPVSVRYEVVGGTAYGSESGYASVEEGMVYGSGKDFTLANGVIEFAPGATSRTIAIALQDDSINEADETVVLRLTDPQGVTLGEMAEHTLTIVDDDRPTLVSVLDRGAKGDGVTDDTAAVQTAVDEVFAQGGGVVLFPAGRTYVIRSVKIYPGITYQGYGATLRRPPMQGKWTRTFESGDTSTQTDAPLIVKGLTFDGNSAEQGPYEDWELEQAALVALWGADQPVKMKVVVEDCLFKDGVGDGILASSNLDLVVYRSEMHDCFRGGVVVVGGYSTVKVFDVRTKETWPHGWATGLDIEVDGEGYGGSYGVDVLIDGFDAEGGDFDIAAGNPSNVRVYRAHARKGAFTMFQAGGEGSTLRVTDSSFVLASNGYNLDRSVLWPGKTYFTNVEFTLTAGTEPPGEALSLTWDIPGYGVPSSNQLVHFKSCTWKVDPSLKGTPGLIAIGTGNDDTAANHELILERSKIPSDFEIGVYSGGKVTLIENEILSAQPLVRP